MQNPLSSHLSTNGNLRTFWEKISSILAEMHTSHRETEDGPWFQFIDTLCLFILAKNQSDVHGSENLIQVQVIDSSLLENEQLKKQLKIFFASELYQQLRLSRSQQTQPSEIKDLITDSLQTIFKENGLSFTPNYCDQLFQQAIERILTIFQEIQKVLNIEDFVQSSIETSSCVNLQDNLAEQGELHNITMRHIITYAIAEILTTHPGIFSNISTEMAPLPTTPQEDAPTQTKRKWNWPWIGTKATSIILSSAAGIISFWQKWNIPGLSDLSLANKYGHIITALLAAIPPSFLPTGIIKTIEKLKPQPAVVVDSSSYGTVGAQLTDHEAQTNKPQPPDKLATAAKEIGKQALKTTLFEFGPAAIMLSILVTFNEFGPLDPLQAEVALGSSTGIFELASWFRDRGNYTKEVPIEEGRRPLLNS